MYSIRHYSTRLRWSKRLPYSIARGLILVVAAIVLGLIVFVLLGLVN